MSGLLAETHVLIAMKNYLKEVFGYDFGNLYIIEEALDTTGLFTVESNARLALLGDVAQEIILTKNWYPTGAGQPQLRLVFDQVASPSSLAAFGRRIGITNLLKRNCGRVPLVSDHTMATTINAILGAIFVDSGHSLHAVETAMIKVGLVPAWTRGV